MKKLLSIRFAARLFSLMLLQFLFVVSLTAQESVNTTGGNATGSGGSASYSAGQVFYQIYKDSTGEVRQGVQQPYEIYTVAVENETTVPISLNIFPNPTSGMLTLDLKDNNPLQYKYLLYDAQGKLIDSMPISDIQTQLSFGYLPTGVYMLNLMQKNVVIKSFKIVKR
jgi:hypothetical protein